MELYPSRFPYYRQGKLNWEQAACFEITTPVYVRITHAAVGLLSFDGYIMSEVCLRCSLFSRLALLAMWGVVYLEPTHSPGESDHIIYNCTLLAYPHHRVETCHSWYVSVDDPIWYSCIIITWQLICCVIINMIKMSFLRQIIPV